MYQVRYVIDCLYYQQVFHSTVPYQQLSFEGVSPVVRGISTSNPNLTMGLCVYGVDMYGTKGQQGWGWRFLSDSKPPMFYVNGTILTPDR